MLLFVLPTGMRLIYHHVRPPELAEESQSDPALAAGPA
jgi:hypothetical protein